MSTERRLKITKGEARYWSTEYSDGVGVHTANKTTVAALCSDPATLKGENAANAALYADAHNTANECDMLPSELLARLREAEKAIDTAHRVMLYRDWNQGHEPSLEREAFEAVNRIRNPHHYITKP